MAIDSQTPHSSNPPMGWLWFHRAAFVYICGVVVAFAGLAAYGAIQASRHTGLEGLAQPHGQTIWWLIGIAFSAATYFWGTIIVTGLLRVLAQRQKTSSWALPRRESITGPWAAASRFVTRRIAFGAVIYAAVLVSAIVASFVVLPRPEYSVTDRDGEYVFQESRGDRREHIVGPATEADFAMQQWGAMTVFPLFFLIPVGLGLFVSACACSYHSAKVYGEHGSKESLGARPPPGTPYSQASARRPVLPRALSAPMFASCVSVLAASIAVYVTGWTGPALFLEYPSLRIALFMTNMGCTIVTIISLFAAVQGVPKDLLMSMKKHSFRLARSLRPKAARIFLVMAFVGWCGAALPIIFAVASGSAQSSGTANSSQRDEGANKTYDKAEAARGEAIFMSAIMGAFASMCSAFWCVVLFGDVDMTEFADQMQRNKPGTPS